MSLDNAARDTRAVIDTQTTTIGATNPKHPSRGAENTIETEAIAPMAGTNGAPIGIGIAIGTMHTPAGKTAREAEITTIVATMTADTAARGTGTVTTAAATVMTGETAAGAAARTKSTLTG